jgi:glycosyltransferase involved in cell wall biosynthesis
MTDESHDSVPKQHRRIEFPTLGIVIIGRNEEKHLDRSIAAIPASLLNQVLYVDSGSSDNSVGVSLNAGVRVHELDPSRSFSASRARSEGVTILQTLNQNLQFVQFVDGDCELHQDWLEKAVPLLAEKDDVAIICGQLSEREPNRTVYNWLNAKQWDGPTGEIDNCGGLFLIRLDVYLRVGGFNSKLITREEKDLCMRIRAAGYRILRLDSPMAVHDSEFHNLNQWLRRALWGGYGDAAGISQNCTSPESLSRLRWYIIWPLGMLLLLFAGILSSIWQPRAALLCVAAAASYAVQSLKLARFRLRRGDSLWDACIFGFMLTLRHMICGAGFVSYFVQHGILRAGSLCKHASCRLLIFELIHITLRNNIAGLQA